MKREGDFGNRKQRKSGIKSREQKNRENTDRNVGEGKVPYGGKRRNTDEWQEHRTGRDKNTRIWQLPVACRGRAEAQDGISIQGDDRNTVYTENRYSIQRDSVADPEADSDTTCNSDADPDPACHGDLLWCRLKLWKSAHRLLFHTFWLVICKLMRIRIRIQLVTLKRIRIQLITLMRIRILPFNLMRIRIRSTTLQREVSNIGKEQLNTGERTRI
jgi:hypothetical protein